MTRYLIELLVEVEVDDAAALSARAVAGHLAGEWVTEPDPATAIEHFANPESALQSLAIVRGLPRLAEACGFQIVGAEASARTPVADERLPWHLPPDRG